MSDDLQPISVVAPKTGMSTSNLRRLALEGMIPSEKGTNGRYLVRLNDVLAYCSTSSRSGATKAPTPEAVSRGAANSSFEIAAMRCQLATLEAENKRLHAELSRAYDRTEKLEDKVYEIMSLYSKMMTETQALLGGATGTQPSNWIHTSADKKADSIPSRGFKGLFRRSDK